jgi:protein TonB
MNAFQRIIDQRARYTIRFEIGLVLALVIIVMAFQFRWTPEEEFNVRLERQEVVHVEEVQQTTQSANTAPAPPAPSVTVEVPNNRVLEQEQVDFDASLDLNEALDVGQDTMGVAPSEGYTDDRGPEKPDEEEEEIFVAVEQRPDCGGVESIQKHLVYPRVAQNAGLQGTVYVQFVVTDDGVVTQPTVTKGVHPMLNEAAVEAVQSLDCTPGRQRDEPVNVQMTLPVRFQLEEK